MTTQAAVAPAKREIVLPQGRNGAASQATAIEQSRAIAQVQGALVVAQQRPRDTIMARQRMEEACGNLELAKRAFFRFPRGGQTVSGPSIHLATELARCWGNVDYGITELRRDDMKGESEMLAYAWDLETNNRVTNSFIVPHKRDKRGGPEALTDMRDIYENNANNAARRLRECIFRVLPTGFREEAQNICTETNEHGGGEPIEQRRAKLLKAFAGIGVTRKQVERRVGKAADTLSGFEIGQLGIVFMSIRRGEITVGEEFPDDTAAAAGDELRKKAAGDAAPKTKAESETVSDILDELPQGQADAGSDEIGPDETTRPTAMFAETAARLEAEMLDYKDKRSLKDWWASNGEADILKRNAADLYTDVLGKVNARLKKLPT